MTTPVTPVANTNSGILLLAGGVRTWFGLVGGTVDFGNGAGPVPVPNVVKLLAGYGLVPPTVGATGWKQREQILNQGGGGANRVLFLPGNEQGEEGVFAQPRRTSGNPRSLWKWERLLTMSVWSFDPSDPDNEEVQIAASDNLLEMSIQALQWFASADYILQKARSGARWGDKPAMSANLPFGREVLIEFIHREPLFDVPTVVVTGVTPNVIKNPAS
jgi:hypothetical protein